MLHLNSKQRLYASLLFLGACVLLFRTTTMIVQGYLGVFVFWVSVLLISEFLIDLGCAGFSILWWISNDRSKDRIPLRLGAAAAILHAIRVLVYVVGRIGSRMNFDIKPEYHSSQYTNWDIKWVYFASIMSILGLLGVVIIWIYRRRAKSTNR